MGNECGGPKYTPQRGDRVRVVIEGEVYHVAEDRFGVGDDPLDGRGNIIYPDKGHVVSVEKLEPPVEVFKPGDVVRYKFGPRRYVYTIATGGYVDHEDGVYLDAAGDLFTSRSYEKIDLG